MSIALKDTREIRGEQLRIGMRTVVDRGNGFVVDEWLTEFVPHKSACHGIHFRATERRIICYERCALVRVLR